MYNDEIAGLGTDGRRGHCKGVIGFNLELDTAFRLVHSTPRYPGAWTPDYPEYAVIYGQTYLCISLPNVKTAEAIAGVPTRQHEPWVYGVRLPSDLPVQGPLRELASEDFANSAGPFTETLLFESKHSQAFRLIAKNSRWGKDFWNELVCDELKCDLNVETWRRGTLASTKDDTGSYSIGDAQAINLEPLHIHYAWPYTQDHAKWAVSVDSSAPWVCLGDINRDTSQAARGGGTEAFQDRWLWDSLSRIEELSVKGKASSGAARVETKRPSSFATKRRQSRK